jgi:hypothetical protein
MRAALNASDESEVQEDERGIALALSATWGGLNFRREVPPITMNITFSSCD